MRFWITMKTTKFLRLCELFVVHRSDTIVFDLVIILQGRIHISE